MKSIVTVAAAAACCLALAACGEAEVAEEPVVAEPMAVEEPATTQAMAADGQPAPGTYEVTRSDGTVWTETVNADGTYSSAGPDGMVETGRWEQRSPAEFCNMQDGETEWSCHAESVSADGVWSSTDSAGDTATLRRVDPTL